MPSRLELIRNYIAYIRRAPKDTKWFFIDEKKEESFIVAGKRLKLLPLEFDNLNKREEFYIHVNAKDKTVMYVAWDETYVAHLGGDERVNKTEGNIEWSLVEDSIFTFLTVNFKELTTSSTPFHDMGKKEEFSSIATEASKSAYGPYQYRDNSYGNYKTDYQWNSSEYKEREAFTNKLSSLLKEGKTTSAIDTIADTFSKFKEEKRLDMIDSIINTVTFDKLNVPVMISILRNSKDNIGTSKRCDFLNKVKTHLAKFNIDKVKILLAGIE